MENKLAGFWLRLLASLMDFALVMMVVTTPLAIISIIGGKGLSLNTLAYALVMLLVFLTPFLIFYNTYFVSKWGGTPGKVVFGLKIIDQQTQAHLDKRIAFLRNYLGYAFSAQFLGLGFWKILKTGYGWHDELFNTSVIKAADSIIIGVATCLLSYALFITSFFVVIRNLI